MSVVGNAVLPTDGGVVESAVGDVPLPRMLVEAGGDSHLICILHPIEWGVCDCGTVMSPFPLFPSHFPTHPTYVYLVALLPFGTLVRCSLFDTCDGRRSTWFPPILCGPSEGLRISLYPFGTVEVLWVPSHRPKGPWRLCQYARVF